MFNRKLKEENIKLQYRIKELEERLCPYEKHDWELVTIDCEVNYTISDTDTVYHYKCRKCGKELRTYFEIKEC